MDNITVNVKDLEELGDNVKYVYQDDLLIIVIDANKDIGMSASGKSQGIASTGGMAHMSNHKMINLWYGKKL
jgi:hypothetical protein